MLKIDQKQKVEDCSKFIKVSLHRENDGTQDHKLFMRDPLEVLQELTGNIKCSGKQYYAFQEYRNEQGERVFYNTNGTLRLQGAQESALELGGPNTGVTYFRPWYSVYFISFHIFSYLFIYFHKWQDFISSIPLIQCRGREIDTDNFNIIESMDDVMFGRAELLFTIKLKCRNGEVFEIPLVCFSAFERVQLESDNEMHKMGDIIQLYAVSLAPSLCMSLSFV